MKRLAAWVLWAVCLLGLASAQTVLLPPVNPVNYFLRILENEASLNVRGVVQERQTFPPRKEAEQTRSDFPAPPPIAVVLLRQQWNVTSSIGENIAGRQTWRLDFAPLNPDAPHFTYWIDREWKIRLAVQETDALNTVTYRAQYSSLEKPTKRQAARKLMRLEAKPKMEAFIKQHIGDFYLPDGFQLFEVRPRTVRDNQNALEFRASNGLSVLVIVFSPVSTGKSDKLAVRNLKGCWVWVIANLPQSELERVSVSIRAPLEMAVLLSSFSNLIR